MSAVDKVKLEISVVLGRTRMPIRHLLKMGRGAVIDLDARMSFAYVMNTMGDGTVGDLRGAGLLAAAYASLDQA